MSRPRGFAVGLLLGIAAYGSSAACADDIGGILTLGEIPVATVRPGESTMVDIQVSVGNDFHVQANPAGEPFLVPLEVELMPGDRSEPLSYRALYPEPAPWRLEGTGKTYPTYVGDFVVRVVVRAPEVAESGSRTITGRLRYQACDNRHCYAPTSVPISFTVNVVAE